MLPAERMTGLHFLCHNKTAELGSESRTGCDRVIGNSSVERLYPLENRWLFEIILPVHHEFSQNVLQDATVPVIINFNFAIQPRCYFESFRQSF